MDDECRFSAEISGRITCNSHPASEPALCTHAAAALQEKVKRLFQANQDDLLEFSAELALARETAFWLDCRWKEPSDEPRSMNTCCLEGTHVCARCELATRTADLSRAEATVGRLLGGWKMALPVLQEEHTDAKELEGLVGSAIKIMEAAIGKPAEKVLDEGQEN